jgi:hypothetical protein
MVPAINNDYFLKWYRPMGLYNGGVYLLRWQKMGPSTEVEGT